MKTLWLRIEMILTGFYKIQNFIILTNTLLFMQSSESQQVSGLNTDISNLCLVWTYVSIWIERPSVDDLSQRSKIFILIHIRVELFLISRLVKPFQKEPVFQPLDSQTKLFTKERVVLHHLTEKLLIPAINTQIYSLNPSLCWVRSSMIHLRHSQFLPNLVFLPGTCFGRIKETSWVKISFQNSFCMPPPP